MSSSKPSGSKTKRKIADEHRNFQEKWELEYFCSEVKDKIICLICNNAISVPKLYNIKRHYEQHKSKYDTYEGLMRQEKLKEFKLGMKKQQFMFTKVSQESEAAVHASYVLSEMIAKHSKPFTEGDFIKECLIKAAEIVCPGSVKTFQAITLSRNTVVKRVTDMARNLNDQIKEKSSCFEAFSIACDETCDTDFNVFEELLELVPMHGTTTGEDIFNCVHDLLQKYNLPQSKLTSVATDGAPSMTVKNTGFVALLRKKLSEIFDGSNIHHTHCIIHQEVLCTKVIKMENVLTPIKISINFIRSRGLIQRQFSLFLTELESEYSGLSYYTEFLITKNQDITLFSDQVWLQDFSFMVDITKQVSLRKAVEKRRFNALSDMQHVKIKFRFSDFKSLEGKFTLFSSIFSINIESITSDNLLGIVYAIKQNKRRKEGPGVLVGDVSRMLRHSDGDGSACLANVCGRALLTRDRVDRANRMEGIRGGMRFSIWVTEGCEQSKSIVITRSDKGSNTVIMNQEDYRAKMHDLLGDDTTFSPISDKVSLSLVKVFRTSLLQLKKSKHITPDDYKIFISNLSNSAYIYGLPKSINLTYHSVRLSPTIIHPLIHWPNSSLTTFLLCYKTTGIYTPYEAPPTLQCVPSISLCFLPYSPSSADIARSLKAYGIRTLYKNSPNLLTSLRHPYTKSHAPPDPLHSVGAVYSVSCEQCSATYVGETGRSVAIRMSEHSRNISNQDTRSLLYQHTLNTGHTFNTNHPTIHYRRIHNQHQRLVLESIESHRHNSINRKIDLPDAYQSVPNHMQMEVIDIQCYSDLKAKFIEVGVSEFYKYLPARFENTRRLAYEIMSMFGSTYRCEQLFSLMKGNKSPIRSRITDVHLGSVLKLITANKISPEVGKMVAEKRCQISGRKY
ncbi:hypothetical protein LAZ67_4002786 [Cordylochernes scorpioides]|uniref:SPIN-DOC-like zinc-finger domain-containing protein n=1 Tax=Cordylochernes scorpioides TaxID=51811 RepID=A0ABY6KD39_9ARAC|nr:hypothetical protein LAZ67_4002786 [Cordylochernes scorpioides]